MRRSGVRAMAGVCVLAMSPWLAGCGVIFGGTRQALRATSSPDGTTVTTTPATVEFKTPTTLNLERKQGYVLTFALPGYTSQQVEVQRSIRSGILVLDILSGLVGVVVDAATGGWYKLSPESVSVTLTKIDASVNGPDTITVALDTQSGDDSRVGVASSAPGVMVDVRAQ